MLLVSSGSGSRGGGEIYLYLLALGLKRLGHEVIALVPDHERMDELATQIEAVVETRRFPFISTYSRRSRPIGAVLDRKQQNRCARIMREIDADIIHINQQVSEDALDLLLAAEKTQRPWVSTIHVGWGASELGAQFGAARDFVANRTLRSLNGHYIAVSETSKAQLHDRLGPEVSNLNVVLNGVKASEDQTLRLARTKARKDWGVTDSDLVIGAVGRIEAQKDPIAFVDRFGEMALPDQHLHLVWIGDGSLRSDLEQRAKHYQDRLTLHVDGWRQDAHTRLAGFDIYALPSKFEGLPLALLEAMHAGLPAIANLADGVSEAIQEGETGFLCAQAKDWHDAARSLINDPNLRLKFGEAAKAVAGARFSVDSMAKSTEAQYNEVLAQNKSGGTL